MDDKIKITKEELFSKTVEDYVRHEEVARAPAHVRRAPVKTPWWLNPIFYTTIAGMLGAFIGWALLEPFYDDYSEDFLQELLILPCIGAGIALFVGTIEGVMSRHWRRAVLAGGLGSIIAFFAGFISTIAANIVIGIGGSIAIEFYRGGPEGELGGMALFIYMIARSMAWAVAGMTVALGQGMALKSKKLTLNGFLGGVVGGAVGGLLFDPIDFLLATGEGAELSRMVGFMVVGVGAGFFVSLVEHFAKDGWLIMLEGPLAGKQFVLYKNPTIVGSSPRCDVYLFKDPDIDPEHLAIHRVGQRFEVEDKKSRSGVVVNGRRVTRATLQDGDRIQIGRTVLLFAEKVTPGAP